MRILGIDCGVKATGYAILSKGVLSESGVIKTEKGTALSSKLQATYFAIRDIIDREKPDITVIESLFYGKNIKSLISLAHLRGVILLASCDTKIYEVTPAEVKKGITGNGRASKQQVRYMVENLLQISSSASEDLIDACACAIWGAYNYEYTQTKREKR
ncbi:crossover junction endodeoxyribonuclease RuvC [candidate division WOR-3 bacterium]|nr:crossover junction endodeoxyribonuclease RuvC [candidate division WOR-3 bacterium]